MWGLWGPAHHPRNHHFRDVPWMLVEMELMGIMLDILVITVVGEIFKSAIVWGEVIMIYVDINLKQIT